MAVTFLILMSSSLAVALSSVTLLISESGRALYRWRQKHSPNPLPQEASAKGAHTRLLPLTLIQPLVEHAANKVSDKASDKASDKVSAAKLTVCREGR